MSNDNWLSQSNSPFEEGRSVPDVGYLEVSFEQAFVDMSEEFLIAAFQKPPVRKRAEI